MKTGDQYFDSDEFRDLLSTYEEAVNSGQPIFMDADELSEIADYYQMNGRTDDADDAIALALSLSPGAIAPLTYKIHEALSNGDTEAAEHYFTQIIETDAPDYVYNHAEILVAKGLVDEADAYLREQLRQVPPDEYQDYVIDVASIYQDYDYNDKAMEWMVRARQEDTPEFKELMARTLFGLGKYKDSMRLFNELIDANPFSTNYWKALASAQFMNQDYRDAVQSSEYAIAIDPDDPDGLISKADSLFQLADYEGALDFYRRYSAIIPDDEFSFLRQGTCLINLEQLDDAISTLQQALTCAPSDSRFLCAIYEELAFAYCEHGDIDQALLMLDNTESLDCDHVHVLIIRGHIMLAARRLAEAEHYFRQAILLSDTPPQTLFRVIVSVYDNRYVETAYMLFKKYFQIITPDCNDGYAYMALCCHDLHKTDEYHAYLKEACRRNPQECRQALGHLFPDTVDPSDYYHHTINSI